MSGTQRTLYRVPFSTFMPIVKVNKKIREAKKESRVMEDSDSWGMKI